jgi:hypothetical protein
MTTPDVAIEVATALAVERHRIANALVLVFSAAIDSWPPACAPGLAELGVKVNEIVKGERT